MLFCISPCSAVIFIFYICKIVFAADIGEYVTGSLRKLSHIGNLEYLYCRGPLRVFQYSSPNLKPPAFGCLKPDGTYGLYPNECGNFEIVQFKGEQNFVIINYSNKKNVRNCIWDQQNYLNCKNKMPQAESRLVLNQVEPEMRTQLESAQSKLLRSENIDVATLFGVYTTTDTRIAHKSDRVIGPAQGAGNPFGGLIIVCSNPNYIDHLPDPVSDSLSDSMSGLLGLHAVKFFRLARQMTPPPKYSTKAQQLQEELV